MSPGTETASHSVASPHNRLGFEGISVADVRIGMTHTNELTPDREVTPRVLVVDDDELLRESHERLLEDGYDVVTARDGEQALEVLDEDVDAVLLDRRMPKMRGGKVLFRLRDRDYDVPVAFVSAVNPDAGLADVPVDDYVVKPVSRDGLVGTIERLLTVGTLDDEARTAARLVALRETIRESPSTLMDTTSVHELDERLTSMEDPLAGTPLATPEAPSRSVANGD